MTSHQLSKLFGGLELAELDELEIRGRRLLDGNPANSFLSGRLVVITNQDKGIIIYYRELTTDGWSLVLRTPVGLHYVDRHSAANAPVALKWLRSHMVLDDLAMS